MSKEERLLATASSNILANDMVDDAEQTQDPALVNDSQDELRVWGCVMTQYSQKPD